MNAPTERRALRREMRRRRRALSVSERRSAARALSSRLAGSRWFVNSRTIAVYLSNDGEIDLFPLVRRAWAMGKRTYLPRLFGPRLWFLPFHAQSDLAANRFSIPEPAEPARRRIRPMFIDLVLFPLVAFDASGNRLGMGAGFYDKTFEAVRRRTVWQGPRRIGVAYEMQRVDSLPAAHWDVPLDAIVTERAIRVA
ncbi:MAG: 5-formyltetrahydrofolate cyclo-ligase [Thiotrichales bacterium]|nr:5-formyltetrahydrofolate cyclo-ligase [Thiotrichales bacterium]